MFRIRHVVVHPGFVVTSLQSHSLRKNRKNGGVDGVRAQPIFKSLVVPVLRACRL
ncbi:hypothetical protein QE369_000913 [Agrobacterium larrymoorei]|uniref:Uncharacterized protein n=1 Tax=Agrobacterium larrymoorei TaxID=160699 RepID=A0AAJ2EQ17_9HYPH|nr:hypothetical protein [Agrobacterium larrymoorei]